MIELLRQNYSKNRTGQRHEKKLKCLFNPINKRISEKK